MADGGAPERPLPGWPRGLRAELAAAYVGLSLSTFLREVETGTAPKPVFLTPGRKVWLREDLDAYLDRKAGRPGGGDGSEWMGAFGASY